MSKVLDPSIDKVNFLSPTIEQCNPPLMDLPQQNRTSMSRALGAAFLSHQVAELERNANGHRRPSRGRGGARGGGIRRAEKDQDYDPEFDRARTKADFGISPPGADEGSWRRRPQSSDDTASESASPPRPRVISHAQPRAAPLPDIIVVDGSVLIHALGAVQRWCRNKHTEVVIPLEALNTLDVLKSGNNQLAVRSRAASRLLEDEVGANPRIRVQRDDAFIPWDTMAAKAPSGASSVPNQPDSRWKVEGAGAPEWMKRMVCCAKWESNTGATDGKRVALAVIDSVDANPAGRHESLVDGDLVRSWASKLGLEVMDVEKEKPAQSPGKGERRARGGGAGSRAGGPPPGRGRSRGGLVEKPAAAIMAPPAGKIIRVLARGEKLDPE
ncbi:hypothetical protein RhiJN_23723 [Ceratobasidium sp. AG-Ba]|nr:hypothetical protein RhiJN_23723 [Ceratobasidium sp. AG-Ba]